MNALDNKVALVTGSSRGIGATHVFARQEGRWRLTGIHLSPILPGI